MTPAARGCPERGQRNYHIVFAGKLRNRRQQAEQTEVFLESEADKLKTEIANLSAEMTRFKQENFPGPS